MEIEKPIYYAKVKGWEHFSSSDYFWNYDTDTSEYIIANNLHSHGFITQLTKEEWNKFGINESNADFEKVED